MFALFGYYLCVLIGIVIGAGVVMLIQTWAEDYEKDLEGY